MTAAAEVHRPAAQVPCRAESTRTLCRRSPGPRNQRDRSSEQGLGRSNAPVLLFFKQTRSGALPSVCKGPQIPRLNYVGHFASSAMQACPCLLMQRLLAGEGAPSNPVIAHTPVGPTTIDVQSDMKSWPKTGKGWQAQFCSRQAVRGACNPCQHVPPGRECAVDQVSPAPPPLLACPQQCPQQASARKVHAASAHATKQGAAQAMMAVRPLMRSWVWS